ncbi:MAG: hypothetical protein KJ941_10125 [Bacteroidetes bacterium]|nr:hypothetical protein [Bacteroidota bacterium]
MDLSRGCIFLARSLDESDIFQNEKWLKVWLWCLIKANHKDKSVPVKTGRGETVVSLKRGQFIFGRHVAARKLRMPPSTVGNIMLKLKNMRNLDIKEDTHFSIVTILEYDVYQNIESYKGQAKGQPKDNQRTTKGQPKDTNNNVKNVKNEKNIYNPLKNLEEFNSNLPDWITSKWTKQQIESKTEDLVDYCKRKNKTYKDYYSALRSFLKKDFQIVTVQASRYVDL